MAKEAEGRHSGETCWLRLTGSDRVGWCWETIRNSEEGSDSRNSSRRMHVELGIEMKDRVVMMIWK
jgi:hypothetical protein